MSIETRSDSYTLGINGQSPAPKPVQNVQHPSYQGPTEGVRVVEPMHIEDVAPAAAHDEEPSGLFGGIMSDLRNRAKCYKSDWTEGVSFSLLAPATYVFFASVVPALTFGEQIADHTNNQFGGTQVLLSTAICGIIQSIFGGQPLLIVGVAEPIILVYTFMYEFCEQQDPKIAFRPFAAATLYWSALMIVVLAAVNSCKYIHIFTRFSGELFGLLIAVLFMQQGIRGLRDEYRAPHGGHGDDHGNHSNGTTDHSDHGEAMGEASIAVDEHHIDVNDPNAQHWLLFNGTWAVFLALGLVWSTMMLREAREWNFFKGPVRKFLAEYATFVTVLVWAGISFAGTDMLPDGIPRRLALEKTTEGPATETWNTINEMDLLSGRDIGIAIVPALIITVLFYFDHNVSAQLAQVEEFKLKKPHAYHWDFFLLGIMTAICGLCGILPVNGVIPQAPMHTKACAEFVKNANGEKNKASFVIREQRWTNLIQSLLCAVCLFITEALKQIPRSVLWGFFIYMALESLPGSQFWERLQLFITDSKRLKNLMRGTHNEYLDKVPYDVITKFTLCQFGGFAICYGISQIPSSVAPIGIFFPILIMLLVPARVRIMTKWFSKKDLYYLDQLEGEEPPEGEGDGRIADGTLAAMAKVEGGGEPTADDALEAAGFSRRGYLGMARVQATANGGMTESEFNAIDADGSGMISLEEFRAWKMRSPQAN